MTGGILALAGLGLALASGRSPAQPAPGLERFTVASDGHPMAVWARRPPSPHGAVLLVHGRTWSSLPDFDLQVPGLRRSVMADLAASGFAAYAVDMRGYGQTPRDQTGWLTPTRAAADIANVLAWVAAQHPTLPKPALVGWSRGAAESAMVAQSAPTRLSALVLFGFVFDPDAQFVDETTAEKPSRIRNTAEDAMSDFISPAVTPPAVTHAFVEQALKADPVLADLKGDAEFNALRPSQITVPTLVIFGEHDPGVVMSDAGKFFARLGAADKQMVSLPGADHAAQLEDTHDAWMAAVVNFLNRPPARRFATRGRSRFSGTTREPIRELRRLVEYWNRSQKRPGCWRRSELVRGHDVRTPGGAYLAGDRLTGGPAGAPGGQTDRRARIGPPGHP
jgi:pimeloyl-ACP methyl ester carboxylesterase